MTASIVVQSMPRRRNSEENGWGGWQGEELALEKEMRKARYSEKRRPPREFRHSKETTSRYGRKRKSRSKGFTNRDFRHDNF